MNTRILRYGALVALFFASGAQAILIDSFDDDALAFVTAAAPANDSAATADSGANMIGDRTISVNKTQGTAGVSNAAVAEVTGGLLSMSNGPVTNSIVTVQWIFALTDLTEGGTSDGIQLALPTPIDNDLTIAFSINGGPVNAKLFPNGSTGGDFFFPFAEFANAGAAASATSLAVTFQNGPAWDAQIDFIETKPPTIDMPAPASLGLFGLALVGLGWSRRKKAA